MSTAAATAADGNDDAGVGSSQTSGDRQEMLVTSPLSVSSCQQVHLCIATSGDHRTSNYILMNFFTFFSVIFYRLLHNIACCNKHKEKRNSILLSILKQTLVTHFKSS
jgi:hypothetical protein